MGESVISINSDIQTENSNVTDNSEASLNDISEKSNNDKKQKLNKTMTTTSRLKYGWRNFFSNIFADKRSISKIRLSRNVSKQKSLLEPKKSSTSHPEEVLLDEVKRVPKTLRVPKPFEPTIPPIIEEDMFLKNIQDTIALAIVLPTDIKGKHVNVAIELEALSSGQHDSLYQKGLYFTEETSVKSIFSGIVKVPPNINLEYIANMPMYFVDTTEGRENNFENKIERVVRPMSNELPPNIDKYALVEAIYIKIKLNHLKPKRVKQLYDPLPYEFFGKEVHSINQSAKQGPQVSQPGHSVDSNHSNKIKHSQEKIVSRSQSSNKRGVAKQNDLINKSPNMSYKTSQIVDNIVGVGNKNLKDYDERSRDIVKEILSHVMNRVQVQDISTQYSKMITNVNKEIDVQKSLLIKNNISCEINTQKTKKLQFMSEILEKDDNLKQGIGSPKPSFETVYPKSSTSCVSSSTFVSMSAIESSSSAGFPKVPNNTPSVQAPRYIIRYDSSIVIPAETRHRKEEGKIIKMLHQPQKHHQMFEKDWNVNYMSLPPQPTHVSKGKKHKDRNRGENSSRKRFNDNARAEIDRTLDLLETARVKLVSYLKRSNYSESDVSGKNIYENYTTDTEAGSVCELIPMDSVLHRHGSPIKPMSKEHRRHQKSYLSRDYNNKDMQLKPTQPTEEYKKVMISDATGKKQFFLDEGKTEKTQKVLGPAVAPPPEILTTTGPTENSCFHTQTVYASIYEDSIERTPSQIALDMQLKERYAGEHGVSNDLSYTIVENDINAMIQDLLSETYTIKELAFANDIPIDTYEEPLMTIVTTDTNDPSPTCIVEAILEDLVNDSVDQSMGVEMKNDVEYIMDFILKRAEPKLEVNDFAKPVLPVQVNYCLIDERIKENKSKAFNDKTLQEKIDDQKLSSSSNFSGKLFFSNTNLENDVNFSKSKIPVTSWNFGETNCENYATLSVKQICLSNENEIVQTDDSLIDCLEKGTAFLNHIYDEICQDSTVFDELSTDKEFSSKQNILEYNQFAGAVKVCSSSEELIKTVLANNSTVILIDNCNNDETDKTNTNIEEATTATEQTSQDAQIDADQSETEMNVVHTSKKIIPFSENNNGSTTPNPEDEILIGITVNTDFGKENIFAPLLSSTSDYSVSKSNIENVSNSSKKLEVLKTATHLISNSNSEILGAEQTMNTQNIVIKSRARVDCTASTSKEGSNDNPCVPLSDDSDSDDGDTYTFVFPQLKEEYISLQELNNEQEINYINENVEQNEELCKHDTFHSQNSIGSIYGSFDLYDYSDDSAKSDSINTNNTLVSSVTTEFNGNEEEYAITKTSDRPYT